MKRRVRTTGMMMFTVTAAIACGAGSVHAQRACELDRLPGPLRSFVQTPDSSNAALRPMLRRELALLMCDSAAANAPQNPTSHTITVLPASLLLMERNGYAGTANDGSLWAGRGLSSQISLGVMLRMGAVTAVIAPEAVYAANDSFFVMPQPDSAYSRFAEPMYARLIDLPRRMGDDAYTKVYAGQSYIRADAAGLSAGISNQNLWSGPGVRSSLLLSNAAPGFPHAFAAASVFMRRLARARVELVGARLSESDFYDTIPGNDHDRMIVGTVEVDPVFAPGLQTAFTRLVIQSAASDRGDLSESTIGVRWSLRESQALLYAEFGWAHAVAGDSMFGFRYHPDASGFVAGLQKTSSVWHGAMTVGFELTALQRFEPIAEQRFTRYAPTWYIAPGHGATNRGELLGSWIGPGSDSQLIFADFRLDRMRFGLHGERIRRNESAAYKDRNESKFLIYHHDLEMTLGMNGSFQLGRLNLAAGMVRTTRRNREFRGDDGNVEVTFRAEYTPWRR